MGTFDRSTIRWSVFALIVTVYSAPAAADWQYTKWGMTPAEVLEASEGQLRSCDAQNCKGQETNTQEALLVGPYRSGEFAFTAFALFDKKKKVLTSIALDLLEPDKSSRLIDAVHARYGEPASKKQAYPILTEFVWREPKDQISILKVGKGAKASTSITYEPRITDSNKGL